MSDTARAHAAAELARVAEVSARRGGVDPDSAAAYLRLARELREAADRARLPADADPATVYGAAVARAVRLERTFARLRREDRRAEMAAEIAEARKQADAAARLMRRPSPAPVTP